MLMTRWDIYTYLPSVLLSNFFSLLADPEMISMVKLSFFAGVASSRIAGAGAGAARCV